MSRSDSAKRRWADPKAREIHGIKIKLNSVYPPEQRPVLLRAMTLRLDGCSWNQITKTLNEEGLWMAPDCPWVKSLLTRRLREVGLVPKVRRPITWEAMVKLANDAEFTNDRGEPLTVETLKAVLDP